MSPPVVSFRDTRFGYPRQAAVIDGLTLDVAPGEIVVLVGRSGAGKSTVLKLVNGLALPIAGSVTVEGRETRAWDGIRLRRRTGYVLQDVGLFPHMTIEENVAIVPRLEGWPADRMRARAHELLELVGLPPDRYAARRPSELSGGQRQRVGVARALAVDPPMLLMDEPFGALDPVTRVELHREFARIHHQLGTTVILVTHDMAEAFALATRIGVLEGGRLVACETPDRIAQSEAPDVRLLLDTLSRRPALEGAP